MIKKKICELIIPELTLKPLQPSSIFYNKGPMMLSLVPL